MHEIYRKSIKHSYNVPKNGFYFQYVNDAWEILCILKIINIQFHACVSRATCIWREMVVLQFAKRTILFQLRKFHLKSDWVWGQESKNIPNTKRTFLTSCEYWKRGFLFWVHSKLKRKFYQLGKVFRQKRRMTGEVHRQQNPRMVGSFRKIYSFFACSNMRYCTECERCFDRRTKHKIFIY